MPEYRVYLCPAWATRPKPILKKKKYKTIGYPCPYSPNIRGQRREDQGHEAILSQGELKPVWVLSHTITEKGWGAWLTSKVFT